MMSSIKAIIPARSGSKRVPHKNLYKLGNNTLCSLALDFAIKLNVDQVIFSSDSDHYLDLHSSFPVTLHKRSAEASSDSATDIDVLHDIYVDKSFTPDDICIWLRPTSPFRRVDECLAALGKFISSTSYQTLRSVQCVSSHPYWMKKLDIATMALSPAFSNYSEISHPQSQLLPPFYEPTCEFDFFRPSYSFAKKCLLPSPMMAYITNSPFVDIDTLSDIHYASFLHSLNA